jgi:hypothetical protein
MGIKLHVGKGKEIVFNPSSSKETIEFFFQCPGCGCAHWVRVQGIEPVWAWNGHLEKPTFSPSLLVNGFDPKTRCHSFVKDGMIQFLNDCHHDMKGQTVEIPDWDACNDWGD